MHAQTTRHLLVLAMFSVLTGTAAAHAGEPCGPEMLTGKYVLASTGFTRPVASVPGTAWTPKAILEVISFNGDGSLTTPVIAVANAFGDLGNILQPPAGAVGAYIVNEDCTGKIHFFDAVGVMYSIYVEPSGDTVHMIQTNPVNNVSQGTARRIP